MSEASDGNPLTEFFPAIKAHQIGYDIRKFDSVKGIFGLRSFQFKM